MTPVLKAMLTLAGVIAAGLPLLWLTAPPPTTVPQSAPATTPGLRTINASLYFSGEPRRITLWHEAKELVRFTDPAAACHFTLNLPLENSTEIEFEIEWPDNTPGMKGATLYLEPEGLENRAESMWTMPEDSSVHDIFYFTW